MTTIKTTSTIVRETTLNSQGFGEYAWTEANANGYTSIMDWESDAVAACDGNLYRTDELNGRIRDERGPVYTDGSGHTFIMVWEEEGAA